MKTMDLKENKGPTPDEVERRHNKNSGYSPNRRQKIGHNRK